ncbi:MAG: amino acid permease [Chlamydiales bacterium]|nr:amino acid permease [Chlamydiales bacterium]
MHKNFNQPHKLGLFGFLMITVSMVVTIYTYPTFATAGFSLIFFLLFAGFLWFIPVCLTAAEMGTGAGGWSNAGVYSWGTAALGERWGFKMIYLQFMEISIGFVPMLYFITGALGYLFDAPILSQPGWAQFGIIFAIFWIISLASFWGTRITKYIASAGFVLGVLLPALILIILGFMFVHEGNTIQIVINSKTFFPSFKESSTLVVLASFVLAFMGAEASAVHVNHLKNPGRNYPLSILILVITTIVIGSLASLTIAMTIPRSSISLNAGIVEAFNYLFAHYGLSWARNPIAALVAVSAIAEIASWVNGPVRGMLFAAQSGLLPPRLAKMNKHHMPTHLMLVQGLLVTIWMVVLTFGSQGGGNMAFFTAIALTVISYLTMYVLMFISYLVLKVKNPNNPRRFNLPASVGWVVALVGLGSTIFAFIVAFAKPGEISRSMYGNYLTILIVAYLAIVILPHIVFKYAHKREKRWKQEIASMVKKGETFLTKSSIK